MKRRVNFGHETSLGSITEGITGDDGDDSLLSEDLAMDYMRAHSIQAIVAAKAATKVFRARAMMARKNKKKDDGMIEVM